jgi:hypothetical protein
MSAEIHELAESARQAARPIAVAVTVDAPTRRRLGRDWILAGTVYIEPDASPVAARHRTGGAVRGDRSVDGDGPAPISIDSAAAGRAAKRLESVLERPVHEAVDPTARMMRGSLTCPLLALRAGVDTSAARLLESTCNSR